MPQLADQRASQQAGTPNYVHHDKQNKLTVATFSMLLMPVNVIFELYSGLPFRGLVSDIGVFEKLVRVRPACVVLYQTLLNKAVEFFRPANIKTVDTAGFPLI